MDQKTLECGHDLTRIGSHVTNATGYRESLSGFCESRGYVQCIAATLGFEISVQFEGICCSSGDRGKKQLRPRKVRKEIVRTAHQGFAGRLYCPVYLGLRWFGKGFMIESGVALHPRLQDRASFGDYCRGATPG